ncbi:MAG: trypsin-like peptidase domain-containing protein [Steroidobacteraceae bacterium]
MSRAHSSLVFLAGSIVGGLALAFVAVYLWPELLPRPAANGTAPAASAPEAAPPPAAVATTAALPADGVPAAAAGEPRSFAPAVERAAPAVVNIFTARVVTERLPRNPLEELFGDLGPRYRQRVERALGSGVIVDDKGHIVTNHHVIANADSIRVQLADGREAEATIVGRDPDTDLAVLKITLGTLPVMPLGRSDALRVGDLVLAIGNPIGLSQTVTHGIISATGRGQLGVATFENFIQTDAPINVGNSGGALIDTSGALIGINTAVVAKNLGVEGIGFAIPVNLVRGVLREIIAKGRVVRGWIGIAPEDIADDQARRLGLARGGVVITNLYVDSPALAAGLQPGDLVLAVDGTEVRTAQEALTRIALLAPGRTLQLRVQRGQQVADVPIEVTERPRAQR